MFFYYKEMDELNETIFGIVRSVGGGLMLVGDLKNYIFDEVILYRENPEVDGEYIDIHK